MRSRWIITLLLLSASSMTARAQEGEEEIPNDAPQQEDVIEAEAPPSAPAPAATTAMEAAKSAQAEANFDALMNKNATPAPAPPPRLVIDAVATGAVLTPGTTPSKVVVPLKTYSEVIDALKKAQKEAARRSGPAVVLGEAEYNGEARHGALALSVKLGVTLGGPEHWKQVPLIGDDVVLVSAKEKGQPIPVSRQYGYNVWVTKESGEREIQLEVLVPARGPRGSIEYDFMIARTPVTRFRCRFPLAGLEPRLTEAVRSVLSAAPGSTVLDATLRPSARVHLVGFRDLGDSEAGTKAKVYSESLNLLSVEEGSLDLFTVIRYTLLYGATKDFQVLIPNGMTIGSAEGEGAFRYTLEKTEEGTVMRGETAFPIRNNYEISLRLHRELRAMDQAWAAPIPRSLGVEREHGWLGVEVPGKLKLEEAGRDEILPIDVRQLPPEMVENAVSPILKAYRYHSPKAAVKLSGARLPEKDPASASIDRVRAVSVISSEGKLLTDLRITLRNRLRHSLVLTLPEGAEVLSTFLGDQPVKPSRDDQGRLMLPLMRSAGGDRPEPFTLQVVLEGKIPALSWFGAPQLALPAIDLPVSSLAWSVYLPARNTYSSLRSEVGNQLSAKDASWYQPAYYTGPVRHGVRGPTPAGGPIGGEINPISTRSGDSADTGSMPVRIHLPETGVRLETMRYWIEPATPVRASVRYIRTLLLGPIGLLLVLAFAAGLLLLANGIGPLSARRVSWLGALIVLWSLWPLISVAGVLGLFAGGALALLVVAHQRGWIHLLVSAGAAWLRTFPERYRAREKSKWPGLIGFAYRLGLAGAMLILSVILLESAVRIIFLLASPLAG